MLLLWNKTKGKHTKIANVSDGINFKYPDLQHVSKVAGSIFTATYSEEDFGLII